MAIAQTEADCHAIREIDGDIDLLDSAGKGRTSEFAKSGYGWLNLSDTEHSVTVKLRRSARNYPKALAADRSTVRVDLFPDVTGWERESDARWRSSWHSYRRAARHTMYSPTCRIASSAIRKPDASWGGSRVISWRVFGRSRLGSGRSFLLRSSTVRPFDTLRTGPVQPRVGRARN